MENLLQCLEKVEGQTAGLQFVRIQIPAKGLPLAGGLDEGGGLRPKSHSGEKLSRNDKGGSNLRIHNVSVTLGGVL